MSTVLTTVDFELRDWQQRAVEAWVAGAGRPYRGTLEIVTGGGKTLIALECATRLAEVVPDVKLAVVVPTEALAHQWRTAIVERTTLTASEVGLMGAGSQDSLRDHRALVCVLNSAAKRLPAEAHRERHVMLVVDECHRAGAPTFSRVLDTPSEFRLGLSATPDRDDLDEDGEPLAYDEQVVGRALGDVVYRFSLKDARAVGWLPEYALHHHGVPLRDNERARYESISRRVDEAADALRGLGGDTSRARGLAARQDDLGAAAKTWVRLTADRKDLLYRAAERELVAVRIIADAFDDPGRTPRAILFHERVEQAEALHKILVDSLPGLIVALEHSKLSDSARREALGAFRTGRAPVLVSVKSLIEGIDVPEADIGISVASTSSVRQRVQSLGRVLRRSSGADGAAKASQMHLIYVSESVDELIYGKADWSDLTGADLNRYWLWSDDGHRRPAAGPPMKALPIEGDAWDLLGRPTSGLPIEWPGVVTGQEYSVDTTGTVRNAFGKMITNPQGVAAMVEAVRGRPGGRFRLTPEHRLVLVWAVDAEGATPYLAGQVADAFQARQDDAGPVDTDKLAPGSAYPGPADRTGGSYKLGQRAGGVIERRAGQIREIALTAGTPWPKKQDGASAVLDAWRSLGIPGTSFFVNSVGDAWFERAGERRFLAHVPEGFAFPTDLDERK